MDWKMWEEIAKNAQAELGIDSTDPQKSEPFWEERVCSRKTSQTGPTLNLNSDDDDANRRK